MYLLTVLRFSPNFLAMALNDSPLSLSALTASQWPLLNRVARDSEEADTTSSEDSGCCQRLEGFPPPKGGGPIEASRPMRESRSGKSRFHRRKAAAPLKLGGVLVASDGLPGFHRRKAAAPLKLAHPVDGTHVQAWFPPPKGGGPIEALCLGENAPSEQSVSTAERRLTGQPSDGVGLAAPRGVLDEVPPPGAVGRYVAECPAHHLELVVPGPERPVSCQFPRLLGQGFTRTLGHPGAW